MLPKSHSSTSPWLRCSLLLQLYWTDLRRRSMEVCELDGANRRVLFVGLDKPRAIVTFYAEGGW